LAQLKTVVALQPKDQLSAQLVQQLEQPPPAAAPGPLAQGSNAPPQDPNAPPQDSNAPPSPAAVSPATPSPIAVANPVPSGNEGKLEGTWTAKPNQDTTITVTFQDQGHFVWKVNHQGQDHQFEGNSSYTNGILTLAQDQNNAMVGDINWQDDKHFQFKVLGGG